ncbi:MAG: hypothetical protein WC375_13345 [Methanomassiliicoccales archaeon]
MTKITNKKQLTKEFKVYGDDYPRDRDGFPCPDTPLPRNWKSQSWVWIANKKNAMQVKNINFAYKLVKVLNSALLKGALLFCLVSTTQAEIELHKRSVEVVTNDVSPTPRYFIDTFIVPPEPKEGGEFFTYKELDELIEKFKRFGRETAFYEMKYPKVSDKEQYVWSNIVYAVYDSNNGEFKTSFTNGECFQIIRTHIEIHQAITTNVTTKTIERIRE